MPIGANRVSRNGNLGAAIPDSVVSRPNDDNSSTVSSGTLRGAVIETSAEWPEIGGRISANVVDVTIAEIYRQGDSQLMGSSDISSLSAGDAFTVDLDNNLVSGETYNFVLTNENNSWTNGFYDTPSFPYTSSDGDLSIVDGADGTNSGGIKPSCLVDVGNVGF